MDLDHQVVKMSMEKMAKKGYFDICSFRTWCRILRVHLPSRDIERLEALHCVHFADMSPEVKIFIQDCCYSVFNNTAPYLLTEDYVPILRLKA